MTKFIPHLLLLLIALPYISNAQTNFYTGCILDPEAYRLVESAAPLMRGDYDQIPNKASLYNYTPIPKNQGELSNCVGWSVAYAARTILYAIQNNLQNRTLISQQAFSPYFLYEKTKTSYDQNCQEGITLPKALEELKNNGVVWYHEYGENCGKSVTKANELTAQTYKIKEYRKLFESDATDKLKVERIKKSLADSKPVIVGIQCPVSFKAAKGVDFWEPKTGDYVPKDGHALTIIAFDDEKYGGSFQLMNSWGTTWGNEGFIWVRYKDFAQYIFEAYDISAENPLKNNFSGKIMFQLSAGYSMEAGFRKEGYYELKDAFYSGALFRIFISNQEPAYIYAFGSDLSKKCSSIFPFNTVTSAYLPYKQNNLAIPDESHFIQLNKSTGIDYFCILYSKEKLDLDKIMLKMETTSGDFQSRLKYILSDQLVEPENIIYSQNGTIEFKAESRNRSIVPIIITLRHN